MSPLALIPPQYQLLARLGVMLVLAALCFGAGWAVNGWRLESDVADVKLERQQAIADAAARSLAAQKKAQADRDELAGRLARLSADHFDELTRKEHENDTLRADLAAGRRVVRIAATCPERAADVPQAAAGGRLDPGAGAVLAPEAGQAVLDLRAGVIRAERKLAACQAAVKCLTGQGACPAPSLPN